MNANYPGIFRVVIGIGLLLFLAGGFSTSPAHSADLLAPNLDPTLTLSKTVIKDDGGAATEANFQAQINGVDVAWDTPISLTPGVYTASEIALVSGYAPSVWTGDCAEDGSITLALDETKTCYITNNDIAPTLKLVNLVNNNDNGSGLADDWTLSAAALSPDDSRNFSSAGGSGSFETIFANVGYDLSESSLLWVDGVEYNIGTWSCDGGTLVGSEITLVEGQTGITCTITNDDIAPILTVVKIPTNDSGFTAVADDFNLTVGGELVVSSVPNPYLANTALAINETLVAGYRFELDHR